VENPTGKDRSLRILEGRDNGHLRLLSASPDRFGDPLVTFKPGVNEASGLPVIEQDTINSLDVLRKGNCHVVAAATKSAVVVYPIPDSAYSATIASSVVYDLRQGTSGTESPALSNARWMGNDTTLALAVKGHQDPLRYLCLTPAGWTHHTAAKAVSLEHGGRHCASICPNSLQPVPYLNDKVLLSSWKDGVCR
jgi:hypothetical protein